MEGFKLQAMIAATELGLFDFLDKYPGSKSDAICEELNFTHRGFRALVALLCAQSLLQKADDGLISLTSKLFSSAEFYNCKVRPRLT